ncbi:hypothetical protein LCGC14_0883770 [marine sediment metagenome]|uniref:Uncharacterized protein n=1 Tax=marine sediment metagenome TaxID=412755 RepID=A0A0F9P628_9ZZZZ
MAKRNASKAAEQPRAEGGLHRRREYDEHQTLLCDMIDSEILKTSRMASALKKEIDEAIAAMKDEAKDRKAAIKIRQGRFDELMEKVDAGQELCDVTVFVTHDFEDGLYIAVRMDTEEEIARRPLRDNERQQQIQETLSEDGSGDTEEDPAGDGDGSAE